MPQLEVKETRTARPGLEETAAELMSVLRPLALPTGPWAVVTRNGQPDNICIIKGRGQSPAMLEIIFRPAIPENEPNLTNFLAAAGTEDENQFYTFEPVEVLLVLPEAQARTLVPLPGTHLSVCLAELKKITVRPGESMSQAGAFDPASHLERALAFLKSEETPMIYDLSSATES